MTDRERSLLSEKKSKAQNSRYNMKPLSRKDNTHLLQIHLYMHFKKVFGRTMMKQNNGDLILGWGGGPGTKLGSVRRLYFKTFCFEVKIHRKLQRNVQGGSVYPLPSLPQ